VNGLVTRELLGETFSFEGKVCRVCAAQLWNEPTQKAFYSWLSDKIKVESFKDKMKVQKFQITKEADNYLSHLEERFLVKRSKVIGAFLSIYLFHTRNDEQASAVINDMSISEKECTISSVKLSPTLFLKFSSVARLMDMDHKTCAEEIVNRMARFLSKADGIYLRELEVALAA
jgi:hypothetical protein